MHHLASSSAMHRLPSPSTPKEVIEISDDDDADSVISSISSFVDFTDTEAEPDNGKSTSTIEASPFDMSTSPREAEHEEDPALAAAVQTRDVCPDTVPLRLRPASAPPKLRAESTQAKPAIHWSSGAQHPSAAASTRGANNAGPGCPATMRDAWCGTQDGSLTLTGELGDGSDSFFSETKRTYLEILSISPKHAAPAAASYCRFAALRSDVMMAFRYNIAADFFETCVNLRRLLDSIQLTQIEPGYLSRVRAGIEATRDETASAGLMMLQHLEGNIWMDESQENVDNGRKRRRM